MEKPRIIEFQHVINRGANMHIAASEHLPFTAKRIFWIKDVENNDVRGEHASKTSQEVVVAIHGKVTIELKGVDGSVYNFTLENAKQGVYIPPLFWGKIIFTNDAILIAFAADDYDENDYVRNYNEFLNLKS